MGFFKRKNRKVRATNKLLEELFTGIDTIQIKSSGVEDNKALCDDVVLKIDEPSAIQKFKDLIAIEEPEEDFYCMCLGDYAVELIKGKELKSTIGFHHGTSISFYLWSGDAYLKYPDELVQFLADLGLKKPLEERIQAKKEAEEYVDYTEIWLNNSPKSFLKYWDQIGNMDESCVPYLKKDLQEEFESEKDLILALCKSFGTTNSLWNSFPVCEVFPQILLNDYDLQVILDAFVDVKHDQVTIIGLGRYLFSLQFRKKIEKHRQKLSEDLLLELLAAFEAINDSEGIEAVEKIRKATE